MVPVPPDFLVERLRKGECILFIGSGLSAAARLPTWLDLLVDITEFAERERPGKVKSADVKELLAKDRLLVVAQHLKEVLGLEDLHRALSERLQVTACPVPEAHQLITQLPFQVLITTNFDDLIEKAFNYELPVATQVDADLLGEYIGKRDHFLLKAHGTLGRPKTIVLTENDYEEMINKNEEFQKSFTALLMFHAILFVGYSIADQDFRLLLEEHARLFGSNSPERFALMKGLNDIEKSDLRNKNIQVLSYDNHDEVPMFFQALLEVLNSGPAINVAAKPQSSLTDVVPPRFTFGVKTRPSTPAEIITRFEEGTAREVEKQLLQDQPQVSRVLKEHLGGERYESLRRQAEDNQRRREQARGNVVVVPGVMGSQLALRNSQGRESLLWVSGWRLLFGGFHKLNLNNNGRVVTRDLMSRLYGQFVRRLRKRWNVLEFPFDWRRDFRETADDLHKFIVSELGEDEPCHIVAHSSGGLVVRAFINRHPAAWERLAPTANGDVAKGGRFVMLGTPNHGAFSSVTLLCGAEYLLRRLSFIDLRSTSEDIRKVFATFPSVYQTLPSPRYHSEWEALYDAKSYGGLEVSQLLLDRGLEFQEEIANAVDTERMVNILGHGELTTCAVEKPSNLREAGHWIATREGDGLIAHALARLDLNGVPIPTYFADGDHGNLTRNEQIFAAVDEVLRIGKTFGLKTDPNVPVVRVSPEEKLGA